jgi:hypothetical protein
MHKHLRVFLFAFILCSFQSTLAQKSSEKKSNKVEEKTAAKTAKNTLAPTSTPSPIVQGTKTFKIVYGSAPWNKDSKQLDQAYMFVHDKNSNRTVKILLEETEPDSSIFSGNFSLDFKSATDLDVYVPPENVRNSDNALLKFNQLFNAKKIVPSPMVFKEDAGKFLLDVYDTKEQANRARKAYEEQVKREMEAKLAENIKPVPNEKALEAAQMAEQAQILAKAAKEAADREAARVRLEQLEAQRLAQMRKEQEAMSAAERYKREEEAKKWADQGNTAYDLGDFKEAESFYSKSVELNPNNKEVYFKYGVSLYRNEKYNDALVAFKLSASDPKTDLEKRYYNGLIHYRLNEMEPAHTEFNAVKIAKVQGISQMAEFYNGVAFFSEGKYEEAQKEFEDIVDNSQDPALDKKAEEYLEKIADAIAAKKEAARRWKVNASFAEMYDSNVLYTPDNDSSTGTAKGKGGLRSSLSGDVDYRLFYSTKHEMSLKANTLYQYSMNSDFKTADPFLSGVAAPYVTKGTLGQRGYTFAVTPGYDTLYMDAEDTGSRKNILNSMYGQGDLVVVMRDNWFADYSLEVRNDKYTLSTSTGDDDQDAMKYTLKTQQIRLLDQAKKQALILIGDVVLNNAKGKNKSYNRLELGALYSAPWAKYKDTTWNTGVMLYKQDYSSSTDNRADTDMSFVLGMNKIITPRWNWTATANYISNASSVDDDQYSKYSITGAINYTWSD